MSPRLRQSLQGWSALEAVWQTHSMSDAAEPKKTALARALFDDVVPLVRARHADVAQGEFGADIGFQKPSN